MKNNLPHPSIISLSWLLLLNIKTSAQVIVTGTVIDQDSKTTLPFVNIGIRHKNLGTISSKNGYFFITIPNDNKDDSLTFSMVGYATRTLAIKEILDFPEKTITLKVTPAFLEGVTVTSKRIEKAFGFTRSHTLVHFVDASTNQNDIFEIAQVFELDTSLSRLTSLNLFISEDRADSATFRINFYSFDGHRPGDRIIDRPIIETKKIKTGFLKFDLRKYHISLKGRFVIGIEFLPPVNPSTGPVHYEVKLGGHTRSFVRSHSLGDWVVPPHHYRVNLTALIKAGSKAITDEGIEEKETKPAFRLFSQNVLDSFSIFVRLPQSYGRQKHKDYPVVYLLDANAYFDLVGNSLADMLKDKNENIKEPIMVGIGYRDFIQNDTLRSRDYTFPVAPASDSFALSGGADKFLRFLETELIPLINRTYHADTLQITLMGHSLGGYFTLYAMQQQLVSGTHNFSHFVAASPSLHYANYYLLKQFYQLQLPAYSLKKPDVFITMGEAEDNEDENDTLKTVDAFKDFAKKLSEKWSTALNSNFEIYPGLYHMETAMKTFEDALKK